MLRRICLLAAVGAVLSCNGSTGYELVTFNAAGSGPATAVKGKPYTFDVATGRVTLTKAALHVGALYLTQSSPTSGGGPEPCTLPGTYSGTYVGEVRGGGDVDLLDPSPQPLSVTGDGDTIPPATGQVWLMHGDVNAGSDADPILLVEGTFESGATTFTFSGNITIDSNRVLNPPVTDPTPGSDPVCKERIVSGIPVALTLAQGGTLVVRVDVRALFVGVPFTDLPNAIDVGTNGCWPGTTTDRCFTDDDSNLSSRTLYANLKGDGPYRFEFLPPGG
jgi:hypothetical protein